MASKNVEITLIKEDGTEKTYKSGRIMARTTHAIMKMYAEQEKNELSDIDMIDRMLEVTADHIFKNEDEVTVDSILDGVPSDEIMELLPNIMMDVMGVDEQDVIDAQEGK